MTPGRKPVPTALKLLRGNPGHRQINANEPNDRDGGQDCPDDFDDETKEEWSRMLEQLRAMRVWSAEYRHGLIEYCEAWQTKRQAQSLHRKLKSPPMLQTTQGNWIQHPLIGTINRQKNILYRWLTEFGMTAVSRSRVQRTGSDKFTVPTRKRA